MKYSKYRLFFGDIHGHSNLSLCGVCPGRKMVDKDVYIHSRLFNEYIEDSDVIESIDTYYSYAKNVSKLDFAALTDHDFSMSDKMWYIVRRKAAEWYSPKKFVTFSAYEWTSYRYGHRNVYFLTDDKPIFRCVDGKFPGLEYGRSPIELWNFLRKINAKAITIPHHPSLTQFPVDWNYYNPTFDRLVEIVSIWGVFEYYRNPFSCITSDNLPRFFVTDALERGYILGIVGGGDTHDCRPGDKMRSIIKRNAPMDVHINPLSEYYVPYFIHNPLGSGLTAVYAKDLTRESIFDALYKRRTYATIGARIRLEFSIDDHLMGDIIRIDDENYKPEIFAKVIGEGEIDRVEIIRNGEVIYRKYGKSSTLKLKFVDEDKPQRKNNYYYLRVVQKNGARAWSSPIWLIYKNILKVDILPNLKKNELLLINSGKISAKNIHLAFLKDKPLRTIRYKIPRRNKYGAFIWLEKLRDIEMILKLRFKSIGKPTIFRGYLKLKNIRKYYVEPRNFTMLKYGGDLFKDDYKGTIEWYIRINYNLSPFDRSSIKGLDIKLVPETFEKASFLLDVYRDDKRENNRTYFNGKKLHKLPKQIVIYDPEETMVWKTKIDKILPSETYSLKIAEKIKEKSNYVLVFPSLTSKDHIKASLTQLHKF